MRFIFLVIGFLTLIFGAVLVGFSANEIYFLQPTGSEAIRIDIQPGATVSEISQILVDEKLISSPLLFKLYVRQRNLETEFQRGTFLIVRGTSIRKIVNLMTGIVPKGELQITIIEGWAIREISAELESLGIKENQIAPKLEGYLFPDTYRIFKDATADDLVRKAQTNFEEKVGAISKEDLILASIVEREVRGEQDRGMVADLFQRRLKIGMALQADSTVNYVTGKNTPALSAEDKALETPYNTYKYRGLPPGPISNPGIEAINAVRNPIPNQYLYFLTDHQGGVHYARTLEEHNQNKAQFLR